MDELVFCPHSVNISNLSAISTSQSALEEERICEIAELAAAATEFTRHVQDAGMTPYEALLLIADASFFDACDCVHGDALSDNRVRLEKYLSALSLIDKATFCELYVGFLSERGIKISEKDFLVQRVAPESFVYVKNPYSDEAYDVFSQDFIDPRLKYVLSFKEALKAVYDDDATYCLLPLEEGGARIPSVARMLFDSDLKINAVTPVFGFDGSADMKYALIAKHFNIPPVARDDDRYLEIRLSTDSTSSVVDVLNIAELYGSGLYRINTVNFESEGGQHTYLSVVFCDEGADFTSLLVYLTLFVTDFSLIGIYKNLE